MDIDLLDEEDFLPLSGSGSDEDVNHHGNRRKASNYFLQDAGSDEDKQYQESEEGSHAGVPKQAKWARLQKFYNDEYVKLFRETHSSDLDAEESKKFNESQYGAITWSAKEKAMFFRALARCGKHNIQRIADEIGSKSLLEVKSYIDLLQDAEIDRQLFEKQTKNLTKNEIPAATDIGPALEAGLENCADALAAFQEKFDRALGEKASEGPLPWLITADVAARLDDETDAAYEEPWDSDKSQDEDVVDSSLPHQLFNLSGLIELSENIFMHGSRGSLDEHWSNFVETNERPSMTKDVVKLLHDISLNFLRRLCQTTLFLAQSRIRSTTRKDYTPVADVRIEDVHAMSQVLNINIDLWNYWTNLPRRANFRVVAGGLRKGNSSAGSLDYDAVEAALAVKHYEGRLRSLSVVSHTSRSTESESEDSERENDPLTYDAVYNHKGPVPEHISLSETQGEPERAGRDSDGNLEEEEGQASVTEELFASEQDEDEDEEDEENEISDEHEDGSVLSRDRETSAAELDAPVPVHMSQRKRKRIQEEGFEMYLQDFDRRTRVEEEHRLANRLGLKPPSTKVEDAMIQEIGRRPKVPRKAVADIDTWRPIYQAAWETYDLYPVRDEDEGADGPAQESVDQPQEVVEEDVEQGNGQDRPHETIEEDENMVEEDEGQEYVEAPSS